MKIDLSTVAEQFNCILVYFFGSQADKGRRYIEGEDVKPDAFSDLDVAVAFKNIPAEHSKFMGIFI